MLKNTKTKMYNGIENAQPICTHLHTYKIYDVIRHIHIILISRFLYTITQYIFILTITIYLGQINNS